MSQPDTRDLVTISIDRADPCTVEIVKPRRRFDPIDGRPNAVRSGRKRNPRHCRHLDCFSHNSRASCNRRNAT